jgi:hypothetical protein
MQAEFAHEQAQSFLRQRNRFAVLAGVLGLTTLVGLGAAATSDEKVVLVPITSERITVSSGGVDAPYLELVTRDTALMLLNRAPESLDYWFYCVKPVPAAKPEKEQPAKEVPATQHLDAITEELRELKARAILYPTPENVTAYIRFQRAQLDRASLFSDVWQRAIWQDPELDYTLACRQVDPRMIAQPEQCSNLGGVVIVVNCPCASPVLHSGLL